MRFPAQSGQVTPQLVVHALDGVRVGLALDELLAREDSAVAAPVIGSILDVRAARNLRAQRSGCSGVTIAQRPAENLAGSAINSPPEPNGCFFEPA